MFEYLKTALVLNKTTPKNPITESKIASKALRKLEDCMSNNKGKLITTRVWPITQPVKADPSRIPILCT